MRKRGRGQLGGGAALFPPSVLAPLLLLFLFIPPFFLFFTCLPSPRSLLPLLVLRSLSSPVLNPEEEVKTGGSSRSSQACCEMCGSPFSAVGAVHPIASPPPTRLVPRGHLEIDDTSGLLSRIQVDQPPSPETGRQQHLDGQRDRDEMVRSLMPRSHQRVEMESPAFFCA